MSVLSLIVNLIFYLAFPIMDGPIWCKDSQSYTSMECMREPLYPLFLKVLRDTVGEELQAYGQPLYLFAAVLIQSAFAAVAVWIVVKVFISLGSSRRQKILIGVLTNGAFWGVQLLNRFAAIRGSAYPECIMTEGFGLSFWILFIASAFCYFRSHQVRYLIFTGVFIFLSTSLRKQLLVSAIVFAGMAFFYELLFKKQWKRFLIVVASCVIALAASAMFDYCYNYTERGVWMQHTGNSMGIDCTLLYTTTSDDAELFTDQDTRNIFLSIQAQMEEQHLRYVDNPSGTSWVELAAHYADAYDVIGYEIMNPVVDQYVVEQNPDVAAGSPEFYLLVDQVEKNLRNGLVHQNMGRFLRLWWFNICKGLVNTVLRMNRILILLAAVLYGVYAASMIRVHRLRKRKCAKAGTSISGVVSDLAGETVLLAVLVMLGIIVNAVVVGAIIFPQTRYMLYNMGLFYSIGSVMLVKAREMHLRHYCRG